MISGAPAVTGHFIVAVEKIARYDEKTIDMIKLISDLAMS